MPAAQKCEGRRISPAAALRTIGTARERAEKARVLLRALGDLDETSPSARAFDAPPGEWKRLIWTAQTRTRMADSLWLFMNSTCF